MTKEESNILEKAYSDSIFGGVYKGICKIAEKLANNGYLEGKAANYHLTLKGHNAVNCKQCGETVKGPAYMRNGENGTRVKLHVKCLDEWIEKWGGEGHPPALGMTEEQAIAKVNEKLNEGEIK